MKTLLSALALTTVLTSAALAGAPVTSTGAARLGPVALTEVQMDQVVAGGSSVAGSIQGDGGDLSVYDGNPRGVPTTADNEIKGSGAGDASAAGFENRP
jgi:hypothetical protein